VGGTMSQANTAELVAAIDFWLDVGKLFFRTFRFRQYLVEQYLFIHQLIRMRQDEEWLVLDNVLDAVPSEIRKARSRYAELSAWLDDLQHANYIELRYKGEKVERSSRTSNPTDTTVKRLPLLESKYMKYGRRAVGHIFGDNYTTVDDETVKQCAWALYQFATGEFRECRAPLVRTLTRQLEPEDAEKQNILLSKMRVSSEDFVILMSLWKAHLLGDDDGYEFEMLLGFYLSARSVELDPLQQSVRQLAASTILEQVPPEPEENPRQPARFRLAQPVLPYFDRYGERLLPLRERLRQKLERLLAPH
jgi:hypothetical protein